MTTIAVTTFKGGTGKTTSAVNLATALVRDGARVLGLDLDRTQQDMTQFAANVQGLEVRPSTAGRVAGYVARGGFDFLVADCPPAFAKEAAAVLRVADLAIVPVKPEMMDLDSLARVLAVVDALRDPARGGVNPNLRVKVLLTMCDRRDENAGLIEIQLRAQLGEMLWIDGVPRQRAVNDANNERCAVVARPPRCEAARIYRAISRAIVDDFSIEAHQSHVTTT